MAKNSPAFDGDWQGDGWGISYLDENNNWQTKKSLNPIWKDKNFFNNFPQTKTFAIHARSASFEHHKGVIDYNQPYINEPYSFVFNGLLKKVHFREKIPGNIGAQKLFFLFNEQLNTTLSFRTNPEQSRGSSEKSSPPIRRTLPLDPRLRGDDKISDLILDSFIKFEQLLQNNVDEIQACNIGLADYDNIYALNLFSKHPEYYRLNYLDTPDLKIICSGPLESMNLTPLKSKTIVL